MKKTIETTEFGPVIHTVNGVDTRTTPVYARQALTFEPLPNGFNQALAEHIIGIISPKSRPKAGSHLWEQASWRKLLDDYGWDPAKERAIKSETKRIAGDTVAYDNRCQTAMCVAGWVGEMTLANWVVDARDLAGLDWADESDLSLVYVTHAEADAMDADMCGYNTVRRHGSYVLQRYRGTERGFTDETHVPISVSTYALYQLGLHHGDWLNLFGGGNTVADIKRIVGLYAEHGPALSVEGYLACHGEGNVRDWFCVRGEPYEKLVEVVEDRLNMRYHLDCRASQRQQATV